MSAAGTLFPMPHLGPPRAQRLALLELAERVVEKAYVSKVEHARLNNVDRSMQCDAPNGNGNSRERYRRAGIELLPVSGRPRSP